jgi:hypothetical protein
VKSSRPVEGFHWGLQAATTASTRYMRITSCSYQSIGPTKRSQPDPDRFLLLLRASCEASVHLVYQSQPRVNTYRALIRLRESRAQWSRGTARSSVAAGGRSNSARANTRCSLIAPSCPTSGAAADRSRPPKAAVCRSYATSSQQAAAAAGKAEAGPCQQPVSAAAELSSTQAAPWRPAS